MFCYEICYCFNLYICCVVPECLKHSGTRLKIKIYSVLIEETLQ